MNRIICDICGSEYAENADRCPICSYPRQGNEKLVDAGAAAAAQSKVKGGRFSDKNVKKRRKAQRKAAESAEEPEGNPNKPLWIVIAILLVAIALVSLYIGVRFFRGRDAYRGAQTTAATTLPTETTQPPTVPCAGISLETSVIALDDAGQEHRIVLTLLPEGTTDTITYVSSDPSVVTVSETGVLTAVGPGQATVTITCGAVQEVCDVICWFEAETTAPSETTAPTEPPETTKATQPAVSAEPAVLTLDQSDVSFFTLGEAFTLRVTLGETSVGRSKVTWTSSDPSVATVEKGLVTAVGKGTATITAEYDGQKATCIIRCRFEDTSWRASSTDVTLSVGESFRLTVTNGSGETADAIWIMDTDGVVSVDGSTITGRAPGTVTLTATVDGVTVSCIVRVK